MHAAGMEICAHGYSHELFTSLDDAALPGELELPKRTPENIIGQDVIRLSYPNGKYNERVVTFAKEAGYQTAVTVVPEVNVGHPDSFLVSRLDTNDLPA